MHPCRFVCCAASGRAAYPLSKCGERNGMLGNRRAADHRRQGPGLNPPNRRMFIAGGTALGLLFAAALVLLLESTSTRLTNEAGVAAVTG